MEKEEQKVRQELFMLLANKSNEINKIKQLLEKINNKNLKMSNVSYLMIACENNNKEIIELLIKKGANINDVDHNNRTALHEACKKGNLEVVKILIENGANIHIEEESGKTAVTFATEIVQPESLEIIKYLKDKGANLLVKDKNNNNLLHKVIGGVQKDIKETIKIIKYLISEKIELNEQNTIGNTPLINAILLTKNIEIVKILIENGADINIENGTNKNAIDLTIKRKSHEILDVLLQYHDNINEKNKEGDTLLHQVCEIENNVEMINILIKHGIDVNIKNDKKQTALEVMKQKKANINSLNDKYDENINFLELYKIYKELKEEIKEEHRSEIKINKKKI